MTLYNPRPLSDLFHAKVNPANISSAIAGEAILELGGVEIAALAGLAEIYGFRAEVIARVLGAKLIGDNYIAPRIEVEMVGAAESGTNALSTPSSKVLRKNLIDAGVEVPDYPNAAHHIVAGNSPKAAESRAILQKYGIDINDAANGVFLPTVKDVTEGAYHPSIHTNAYYDEVNNLLSGVTSKQDALDILNYISESLQNGTFMH